MTKSPDPLFQLGSRTLASLRAELTRHDVEVAPTLELRRGQSLLSHYSIKDGHIYLSTPDPHTPGGKFQLLLLRSLVRLETDSQIYRLLELLIPWLIAHEIAHHLRHRSGRFNPQYQPTEDRKQAGENGTEARTGIVHAYMPRMQHLQSEETIANQMASALILPRLSPCQKAELCHLLKLTMHNIAGGLQQSNSMGVAPEIGLEPVNADADPLHYVLAHMRWLYRDLHTPELPILDVWINRYLS